MKTILVEVDLKGAPEAIRNIDGLENAISSLEDELKQAEFGSKEFNQLSKELTKARKELKNTELALEALDSEQVASEFGSLTGAVGDLTGAFVLLGGEDSPVAEVGEKIGTAIGVSMAFKGAIEGLSSGRKLLNNALATSNTLQKINNAGTVIATAIYKLFGKTVDTTSKSFKGLRTAIIATGIGALVVAVGALIANWDKLSAALRSTTAEQDAYNEASQKAIENVAKELSAADKLKDVLNDETITRKEKVKAVKKLQEEYPTLLSNVDAEKDGLTAINNALELNTQLLLLKAKQEAVAELRAEKFKEIIQAETEARAGQNVGLLDHIAAIQLSANAQQVANAKTAASIKENEKQVDVLDRVEKSLQAEIEGLKSQGAVVEDNTEKIKEAVKASKKAAEERRIQRMKDSVKEMEFVKGRGAQEIEVIHQVRDVHGISLDEMHRANMLYYEALDEERQKDAARERAVQSAKLNMTADALGAIGSLANTFAKDTEESQKKAFKINKAVGIAQALIQTYQAAQGAYLSQLSIPTPDAPIRAKIAAGVATAVGLANVAAISAQKFQYSGTTAPSPSGGLGGGIGGTEAQPPAFNVVGQSGFNQIATAIGQDQPPIQAFVVSQDVTTAQQLDNAIIETATF
mgnify:CR=1 FL=1